MTRKSPVHHRVKTHTRTINGEKVEVKSFTRGRNIKSLQHRQKKIVGRVPQHMTKQQLKQLISGFQYNTNYTTEYTSGGCGEFAFALADMLGPRAEVYTYGHVHYFVKYNGYYVDAGEVYNTKNELKETRGYPLEESDIWIWRKVSRDEVLTHKGDEQDVVKVRIILEKSSREMM